jgi:hypothetical protein
MMTLVAELEMSDDEIAVVDVKSISAVVELTEGLVPPLSVGKGIGMLGVPITEVVEVTKTTEVVFSVHSAWVLEAGNLLARSFDAFHQCSPSN